MLPRLMLVTDRRRTGGRDLVRQVEEATRGGVGIVQVREKDLPDEELLALALRIRDVCGDALLVVNGRPAVARAAGAGLHLPAGAPAPADRQGLPLLGRSIHDAREARAAVAEDLDYVILGPIFPTASKPGHPGTGVGQVREVTAIVQPRLLFAIGGIDASRAAQVIAAGAHGVAVCGAVLSAADPRSAAEQLRHAVEGGRS